MEMESPTEKMMFSCLALLETLLYGIISEQCIDLLR